MVSGHQEAQLDPGSTLILEAIDPLPSRELPLVVLTLDSFFPTPQPKAASELFQLRYQRPETAILGPAGIRRTFGHSCTPGYRILGHFPYRCSAHSRI